jgi:hypothetical protein
MHRNINHEERAKWIWGQKVRKMIVYIIIFFFVLLLFNRMTPSEDEQMTTVNFWHRFCIKRQNEAVTSLRSLVKEKYSVFLVD